MIAESSKSNFNKKQQVLTSFPGDNVKHIDYVIVYDELEEIPENELSLAKQIEFFTELKRESFDIYNIGPSVNGENCSYALLHCGTKRLLKEAENIRLKMKLKNIQVNESCVSQKICSDKIKNSSNATFWTTYDPSVKFLFEGANEPTGPFNTATRILLVDSILKNLTFSSESQKAKLKIRNNVKSLQDSKSVANPNDNHATTSNFDDETTSSEIDYNKGLPLMLQKKYFKDAFPLHDQSSKIRKVYSTNEVFNILKLYAPDSEPSSDDILYLNNKWAKFSRIFCFQPLNHIKNYFGELNAFYFAWLGTFINSLILPALIGIVFFAIGQIMSLQDKDSLSTLTATPIGQNFTFGHLIRSFDNDLSLIYAVIICLWGAIFLEVWKRRNSKLAYEWSVKNFDNYEPDLPGYIERKQAEEKFSKKSVCERFFRKNSKIFKSTISWLIIFSLMAIAVLEIFLLVIYRLYVTKVIPLNSIFILFQKSLLRDKIIFIHTKVAYPDNIVLKYIIGEIGSALIEAVFTVLFTYVFEKVAIRLTDWENHRTRTIYHDSLILKLFSFEFVNNYGPLFYLAYCRNISYSNGLFNLGPIFQDGCEGNNCMQLLTIQMFLLLLIKPTKRFVKTVIVPLVCGKSLLCCRKNKVGVFPIERSSELAVSLYISVERNKDESEELTAKEFTEKVIYFGYLMLFACTLYIGPLMLLIILLVDLRVDANRLLFMNRRPVAYKAQDIGSWFNICRLINAVGIVNNGFLIAFVSEWSKTFLNNSDYKRWIFLIIFEHSVFLAWLLIIFLLPDTPQCVLEKSRQEQQHVKEILSTAKYLKYEKCYGDDQCTLDNIGYNRDRQKLPGLNKKEHPKSFDGSYYDSYDSKTNPLI